MHLVGFIIRKWVVLGNLLYFHIYIPVLVHITQEKLHTFPLQAKHNECSLLAHCPSQGTDDNILGVRCTFSDPHAVRYATSLSRNEYKWALIVIKADIVLRRFILRLFPLTPFC